METKMKMGKVAVALIVTIMTGCGNSIMTSCPEGALCQNQNGGSGTPDLATQGAEDGAEMSDLATSTAVDLGVAVDLATGDLAAAADLATVDMSLPAADLRQMPDMALFAATCAEILAQDPNAKDGTYRLFVQRDPQRPWDAYCVNFANKRPREYLTLPTGRNTNYGQYTAGGSAPGTDVRTSYQRVRIDPVTLLVDVSDETFSTSTGQLSNPGGPVVTSVAFGAALDCAPKGLDIPMGSANIDLRGSPFSVKQGGFMFGPPASSHFKGSTTYSNGNQVVNVIGGGYCGGFAAGNPWPYGHFDIPVNGIGGFYLQLEYR